MKIYKYCLDIFSNTNSLEAKQIQVRCKTFTEFFPVYINENELMFIYIFS